MKKTILAVSLALIAGSAIACDNCTGYSGAVATGGGVIAGGGVNAVGAYSTSTNGASKSFAAGETVSAAGLSVTNKADTGYGNTASASSQLESYTFNSSESLASNKSFGAATGGALAAGAAGSGVLAGAEGSAKAVNTERVWFFNVPTGKSEAEYQVGIANGSVAASGVLAGRNEIGAAGAESTGLVNAIAGVEVKNCDDIASVEGYFADSKKVTTETWAFGNAHQGSVAAAGGIAFGTYQGSAWNIRGDMNIDIKNPPKPPREAGQNPGNANPVGNSPWDGILGNSNDDEGPQD